MSKKAVDHGAVHQLFTHVNALQKRLDPCANDCNFNVLAPSLPHVYKGFVANYLMTDSPLDVLLPSACCYEVKESARLELQDWYLGVRQVLKFCRDGLGRTGFFLANVQGLVNDVESGLSSSVSASADRVGGVVLSFINHAEELIGKIVQDLQSCYGAGSFDRLNSVHVDLVECTQVASDRDRIMLQQFERDWREFMQCCSESMGQLSEFAVTLGQLDFAQLKHDCYHLAVEHV